MVGLFEICQVNQHGKIYQDSPLSSVIEITDEVSRVEDLVPSFKYHQAEENLLTYQSDLNLKRVLWLARNNAIHNI